MPTEVRKGIVTTFEVFFFDKNGDPVIPEGSAQYRIRDHNKNLVLSGSGSQTIDQPERWSTSITIPLDADVPTVPTDKYTIHWILSSKTGMYSHTDYFMLIDNITVSNADTLSEAQLTSTIILEGSPFEDGILLPRKPATLSLTLYAYENNTPLYTHTFDVDDDITKEDTNGILYYHTATLEDVPEFVISNIGINGFTSIWQYKFATDIRANVETHAIYIVNQKYISLVNQVKREIDHGMDLNIDKHLSLTETDYIHFLLVGMQRINVSGPSLTNYTISLLPSSLVLLLTKAACYEALNALYLSKGMSAFDFSGQATQLNVDHTQYIEAQLGRLDQYLSTAIVTAKRLAIRRGSPGVLGISANPMLTVPGRINVATIIGMMNQYSTWGSTIRMPGINSGIP